MWRCRCQRASRRAVILIGLLLLLAFSAETQGHDRSGEACAFVTIVFSADFVECAAVLAHSLRATGTRHEVVVLVHPSVDAAARRRLLEAGAQHVVEVQEVENPNRVVLYRSFARNYGILRVWQLNSLIGRHFGRAVYMDADMVALQSGDELCALPELAASRDLGGSRDSHGEAFNAGLMVLAPSEATFARLVDLAPHVASPSGGVQPLLRAGFPAWTRLDHFRDNVNVHVFEHQRAAWQLWRIRSIHYTGPVKPCLTDAEDSEARSNDEPFRVWHTIRRHMLDAAVHPSLRQDGVAAPAVNFSSLCMAGTAVAAASAGDDGNGAACAATAASLAAAQALGDAATVGEAAVKKAWSRWWALPSDDILRVGFGYGEDEYRVVPAFHACKHGAATLEGLAQRIFEAGLGQLRSCIDGACSSAAGVADGIARAARWAGRTLQLFLERASIDAQAEVVDGLGSVEAVLIRHGEAGIAEVRGALAELAAEAVTQPDAFAFDLAASLARRLLQRGRLARWHLTYALLGLLWSLQRQLREGGGDGPVRAPASFSFSMPPLDFQDDVRICCRVWDVLGHLLAAAPRGALAVIVSGGEEAEAEEEAAASAAAAAAASSRPLLEEVLLATVPHVTFLVVGGGLGGLGGLSGLGGAAGLDLDGGARHRRLAELEAGAGGRLRLGVAREEVPATGLALVLVACRPGATDPDPGDEEQHQQADSELVGAEIAYWARRGAEGSDAAAGESGGGAGGGGAPPLLAGCGLSPRRPGLVEAVGAEARRQGVQVSTAADGVWWWRLTPAR